MGDASALESDSVEKGFEFILGQLREWATFVGAKVPQVVLGAYDPGSIARHDLAVLLPGAREPAFVNRIDIDESSLGCMPFMSVVA
ncbi:hypothetical protein DMH26_21475 [Streptomyces sp. WAC 05379]|uniref:hypothetical protein n=1 Tax=Streptomyces sp. WAC 05379 TaxID=2203207 RepID=UPI000F736256|nr:hypothetical protein [Streptomyces sp. WAC 05379]RSN95454.1 hypothetical protein DMH26_21475 [Streptomyces sp. WAC 05379]